MTLDVEFNENEKELAADFSENEQRINAEFDSVIAVGVDPEAVYNEGYEAGQKAGAIPLYYAGTLGSTWRGVIFPENFELTAKVKGVSSISQILQEAKNIKAIKLITETLETVINALSAFRESPQLELIDLTEFNRKFNNIQYWLFDSSSLKTVLGALDVSECTTFPTTTFSASALENIEFVPNTIKVNIYFSNLRYLSSNAISSIIEGLADLTGSAAQTVYFHSTVLSKITADQYALAQSKNWTVG